MAHDARNEKGLNREVRQKPPNLEVIDRRIVSEGLPERFKDMLARLEAEQTQSPAGVPSDVDGQKQPGEQPHRQERAEPE
jgi:hypothetical protein